jgi:hypothetical protein
LARPIASAPSATSSPPTSPFSPEHLQQLGLARQRGRKIRRAAGVAVFNGYTIAIFAGLSLLIGLFSLTSLLIGIALAVVAYNEFAGAKLLRQLDLRGPRRLGFNQLALCAVLITYAVWSIYSTFAGPSPYATALGDVGPDSPAAGLVASIEGLHTTITLALYGGLIVGSVIFQGATAAYYFTRARYIRAYLAETPEWIQQFERGLSTP